MNPFYVSPCHFGMALPLVADGGDGFHTARIAAMIPNKQSRTDDNGWSYSFGVERGAKTHRKKRTACYIMLQRV
jgi:hypothetical protein